MVPAKSVDVNTTLHPIIPISSIGNITQADNTIDD